MLEMLGQGCRLSSWLVTLDFRGDVLLESTDIGFSTWLKVIVGQGGQKGSHLGAKDRGPGLVSNFRGEELGRKYQKNSLLQFSLPSSLFGRDRLSPLVVREAEVLSSKHSEHSLTCVTGHTSPPRPPQRPAPHPRAA